MPKIIMTKKRAREWIRTINKLIMSYKDGTYDSGNCPFCILVADECKKCIWMILERRICFESPGIENSHLRRISRLNRWKARLNKIINHVA